MRKTATGHPLFHTIPGQTLHRLNVKCVVHSSGDVLVARAFIIVCIEKPQVHRTSSCKEVKLSNNVMSLLCKFKTMCKNNMMNKYVVLKINNLNMKYVKKLYKFIKYVIFSCA